MTKSEDKNGVSAKKADVPEIPKDENPAHKAKQADGEIGGPKGLEPTRYGDWERKGIVSDF